MDVPEFFPESFKRVAAALWPRAASQNPIVNRGLAKLCTFARIGGDCVHFSSIQAHPFAKSRIECRVIAVHHKMRSHNSAPKAEPFQDLGNLAVHSVLAHQIYGELASESLLHRFHSKLDLADI